MLRSIADGLWEASTAVKFAGIPMTARMTAVQLGDGGLFVHSPAKLTPELREAIDQLGPVRGLVAPNLFHHMFIDEWRDAYPDAHVAIAPGLADKRGTLAGVPELSDEAPATWSADVDQVVVRGVPKIGEVAFFHRASRTLINTDMTHNVHAAPSWIARTVWRLSGSWKKFGPGRLERLLTRDKTALRESLERILEWDFDRVIVAHGDVLETGGKDGMRAGFHWALP